MPEIPKEDILEFCKKIEIEHSLGVNMIIAKDKSILADINEVTQGKLTMSQAELEKLYDISIAITKDENLTMCVLRGCLNNSWVLRTQDTNYSTTEDIVKHMSSVHKTLRDTDWEGVL